MISGFELETRQLSTDELKYVDILVNGLNNRFPRGKAHKQNSSYFLNELSCINIFIDEVRLRKLFQHIRVNDLVMGLCSDSRGYWLSDNKEELKETLISLNDRLKMQQATLNALIRQYKKLYGENKNNTLY
jgi:hypothetical protein